MAQDVNTTLYNTNALVRIGTNFGKARGHQDLTCTTNTVVSLTIPVNIQYAQLRLATTSTATNTPVAWYLNDGGTPSAGVGIPLLGWETFDITDFENINNFKIFAVGGTEVLHVQYYNLIY